MSEQDFSGDLYDNSGDEYGGHDVPDPLEVAQQQQYAQQATEIVQELPALGDPEVAQATIEAARFEATRMGRPELAEDLGFVRQTYLARAGAQALQPTEDDVRAIEQEQKREYDNAVGDLIINGDGQGRRALPF